MAAAHRVAVFFAAAAVAASAALAAEWPSKPVRLVVPFAAGGAADTIGRLYAEALGAAFGKPFYVENRVGGGGLLGTEAVARAEPDGLTLMVSGIPTHVLGPAMNKNVGFDPMRDFTHIAYFGGTPNVLLAHPSLGVTTYQDFLALAREAKGIEYVSAGFGTMGNWIAEFLAAKEGADVARARARRFRGDDLVFAFGTRGPCAGYCRERQPRSRQCLGAAAAETPDRARRDRNQSDEPGRGHPLHPERDRPLDADDQATAGRELGPTATSSPRTCGERMASAERREPGEGQAVL